MKARKPLTVKKIGKQYMLVDSSNGAQNETSIYTMNATAAFLWGKIGEQEFDAQTLIGWLVEKYDVETTTASHDISALLDEWKSLGLIVE